MEGESRSVAHSEVEAVVHRVDPVNRELAAFVDGDLLVIDIPPDCGVVLHGERVKLRMVQPRDRVRVTYAECTGSLLASAVEVQPASPRDSRSPTAASPTRSPG